MDLTISIKHQIVRIKELENNLPIDLILNHLERAELLYNLAIKENDENYFTDVIYRTNQVFEGALRIAYMVLSEKTEAQTLKKRTIDIEEYLTANKILKGRVLDQFSNYRTEWRNPSTHDFKLLFSESESILAVSNVSAFTYVLLNQVIQKLSYNLELRTKTKNKNKIGEILNQNISPKEKLIKLLIQFNHDHKIFLNRDYLRETEVIGALSAYLTANETIKLETDVLLEKSYTKARVDLTVQIENEKFIVEVKRPNSKDRAIYIEQMLNYLSFLNLKHGILYIPNSKDEVRYIYSQPSILEEAEMTFVG
nr:hypothetical protein [uncultured Draconibacterium sp.]